MLHRIIVFGKEIGLAVDNILTDKSDSALADYGSTCRFIEESAILVYGVQFTVAKRYAEVVVSCLFVLYLFGLLGHTTNGERA